jgi:hypothetical protein
MKLETDVRARLIRNALVSLALFAAPGLTPG